MVFITSPKSFTKGGLSLDDRLLKFDLCLAVNAMHQFGLEYIPHYKVPGKICISTTGDREAVRPNTCVSERSWMAYDDPPDGLSIPFRKNLLLVAHFK